MENGKEEKGKETVGAICGIILLGGLAFLVIGVPTWIGIDIANDHTRNNCLTEIKQVIDGVDESKIPDLKLYNVQIDDIAGARFRIDEDKKFIDIIGTEYGTGSQYRFSFQISDDYYNQNRDKIDELKSSAAFLSDADKKNFMHAKVSIFKMLKELATTQKISELAWAGFDGAPFEIVATGLDGYDLTNLSENTFGDAAVSLSPTSVALRDIYAEEDFGSEFQF